MNNLVCVPEQHAIHTKVRNGRKAPHMLNFYTSWRRAASVLTPVYIQYTTCNGQGFPFLKYYCSRYSDSLPAGRSGDRILVRTRFSAHVKTGPGAHPASYRVGTGSFEGLKRLGPDVDHPPLSSAKVKEREEPYEYFPSAPSWPFLGQNLLYLLFPYAFLNYS